MVKDFWVQVLHHNREWICMDKTHNTLITHTCLPNNSNSKSLLARWDIKVQVDMIVVVDIKPHTVEIHRSEGEKAKGIHTNHIGTRLPDKDMLMVAVWRTCEWHPHILSLRFKVLPNLILLLLSVFQPTFLLLRDNAHWKCDFYRK